MKELLRHISDEWFLAEPLLFDTLCSHELVENLDLKVEMQRSSPIAQKGI